MRRFFVDAFYWIALVNCRDQWHRRVQAFNCALDVYHLYTTDEVLVEFLTFCGEGTPYTRKQAALFARMVLDDPPAMVISQTHASFLDGLALYESRLDKHYSLTDCIAMPWPYADRRVPVRFRGRSDTRACAFSIRWLVQPSLKQRAIFCPRILSLAS